VIIKPLFALHFFDPGDGALQEGFPGGGDKPGFGHSPLEWFAVIHPLVGVKILDRRIEAIEEVSPSLPWGPHVQLPAKPASRAIRGKAFSTPFLEILPGEDLQIRHHQAEKASGLEDPEAFPEELPGFFEMEVFQEMGSVDGGKGPRRIGKALANIVYPDVAGPSDVQMARGKHPEDPEQTPQDRVSGHPRIPGPVQVGPPRRGDVGAFQVQLRGERFRAPPGKPLFRRELTLLLLRQARLPSGLSGRLANTGPRFAPRW
jgi:hypothetical protein